jgi:hypothetical protein
MQMLFLAGVTLVIGVRKTSKFFFQRRKIRGTACFLGRQTLIFISYIFLKGGVFLVITGWAFIGIIVEAFGFVNLFG